MNILKRFGSGSTLYTFPAHSQITYEDDFDKLANKIIKLAGVNGGYRQLGSGRGQSVGGTVKADLWLTFDTYVEATDKVNSLRQMADWGLMPLVRQPLYGAEQFCWAVFNSAALKQDVKAVPHVRQRIPLVFEVPDPFWQRTVSGFGFLWDDGTHLWDDGSKWDTDNSYTVTNSLTQAFSNGGNTYTLPRLFLANSSGVSVGDIRVQRIVGGAVEDDFTYDTALATGTYLDVDQVRRRVTIGPMGTNALDDFTALKGQDWLRLLPGSNSIKVTCGGVLTLYMQYLERFI